MKRAAISGLVDQYRRYMRLFRDPNGMNFLYFGRLVLRLALGPFFVFKLFVCLGIHMFAVGPDCEDMALSGSWPEYHAEEPTEHGHLKSEASQA